MALYRLNSLNRRNKITRWVSLIFILYLVMLFVFSNNVPGWVVFMQLFLSVEFVFAFIILQKLSPQNIVSAVGLLVLINTLFVRFLFSSYGIHPFGPDPADSLTYLSMSLSSRNLSIEEYIDYLNSQDINIDDFGMLLIGYISALIGGSEFGYMAVLVLLNATAVMLSTYYVFKTARLLMQYHTSLTVMIIWGLHQGFVALSVFGLKENFFLVFVVLSVYHLVKFLELKKIYNLSWGVLFVLITCLFRLAVGVQFLIAVIIAVVVTNSSRGKIITFGILIVASYLIISNLDQLIFLAGGQGLDTMLQVGEDNASSIGTQQSFFAQIVYAIIGAPARFKGAIGFNHLMSFTSLMVSIISIFFMYSMVLLFKKIQSSQLFLLMYWILGAGMLTLALRGSDFRFASLYFPSILLMSGVGYEKRGETKWFKLFFVLISIPIFILTIIWNR